jgi:plastocyanin
MRRNDAVILMSFGAALALSACGGDKGAAKDTAAAAGGTSAATTPAATAPGAASEAATPAPGRSVIVVKMITDGVGNRFEPNKLEVKQGDVLRFTIVAGVHNVHFLPDSNPGKTGLPPASAMLQLPGQTLDIPVNFKEGHYYFQCDPHALLGMPGRLEVED